jgi:uncharacterized membrane protein
MNDNTSDIPQQEPHDSTGNPVAPKKSKRKKTIAGIVAVLVAIVLVAVGVVLVVTLTTQPNVIGTYTSRGGMVIRFSKGGVYTDIWLQETSEGWPPGQLPTPNHYWVDGNKITIGNSKSGPKGPPAFTVVNNNRLVGTGPNYAGIWVKQLVKLNNRPASLVGTYTAVGYETLLLYKSGAAYDKLTIGAFEQLRTGTWVAGKNSISVTYSTSIGTLHLRTMTYTINGKNLVGEGTTLAKTSNNVP